MKFMLRVTQGRIWYLGLLLSALMLSVQPGWAQNTSPTMPASPWVVSGITVTLSDTAGFARDTALEQAARQALPKVLSGPLGLPAAEATKKAKTVGEAMRFVSRYQIVRESVLPSYTLVADLTFNETLLRKNFGGVVSPTILVSVSASAVVSGTAAAPVTAATQQRWVVRLAEPSAAGQDRARRALAALPNTTATLQLIAPAGVEFLVTSSQTPDDLRGALAGWQPELTPAPERQTMAVTPGATETPAAETPATPSTPRSGIKRPAWLPDLW